MSYFNDPREMVVKPESGITLEQDNRNEEMYHWGAMVLDLCELPVEEYMKPMTVIAINPEGDLPDTSMYTVKFVIDNEVVSTKELQKGEIIPFEVNPEKEGRNFKGWYYGNTLYSEGSVMPSRNITLTAKYECDLTFIFVIEGEETIVSAYTVSYNSKPTMIPSSNKPGYNFLGWEPSVNEIVTKHTTFIGTFEPIIYTVTWSGYSDGVITQEYKYGDTIIEPIAPEKEGYTFKNWDKTIPNKVTSNLEFIAEFTVNKYNINYYIEIDGEKGKPISSFTQNYGTKIILKPVPSERGYSFSNWLGYQEDMLVPAHDVDFISVRTTNSYILSYFDNNEFIKKDEYLYREVIIPYSYKKEGWTVSEWINLPATMPFNNISAHCTSTINVYQITFIDQDGNKYITEAEYNTPIKNIIPKIEGKTFNIPDDIINKNVGPKDMVINGIVTVNNYDVSINIDGIPSDIKELPYGTNVEEYIKENIPVEEGYTIVIESNYETVPANNSLVVNITFKPNIWMLSYSTIGSKNNLSGKINIEFNSKVLNYLPATKQEGYIFGGWVSVNDGTAITKETTMPNNNLEVRGDYKIIKHTVIVKDGDLIILNKSYDYGTQINEVLNDSVIVNYTNSLYENGYNSVIKMNGVEVSPDMLITTDINLEIIKTPRAYILTFMNDENVISSEIKNFNTLITYPVMNNYTENGIEYVFEWEDESWNNKTMPNYDLTIKGIYKEKAKAPIYYGSFKIAKSAYTPNDTSKYYDENDIKNTEVYIPIATNECEGNGANITVTIPVDNEMLEISQTQGKRKAGQYQQLYYRPLSYLIPVEVNNNYNIESTDAVGVNIFNKVVCDNKIINIDGNDYVMYVHQTDYTTINSEVQYYQQKLKITKK